MESRPSTHKRSKSSRIINALRGVSPSKDAATTSDAESNDGGLLTPTYDPNKLSPSISRVSMGSNSPVEQSNVHQAAADSQKAPATGLSTTPSIQDSVRTFKVFEALRSNDDAAVAKAIQESMPTAETPQPIPGTTILHLAIQCAEPQVVDKVIDEGKTLDLNTQDRDGNTALHLAAQLGRASVVNKLLEQSGINDAVTNRAGKLPIDLARTPEIFSQLQLARSLFLDSIVKQVHTAVAKQQYKQLEEILTGSRTEGTLDVNALELATEQATVTTGGTLLHEAARNKDLQLAQILLLHGADPFRRDRKGKLPQDVTKDERTKAILKKSPAAAVAQRGVQEKAILGSTAGPASDKEAGKESREMKGYLKKWTNYTSGYKLRWFVLEDGVLSYYKNQDDAGSACRGAINMRIAKLHMDPQDKTRFEIQGKSSVKYHLKANHVVEAKRWFWALNNAIQYTKDEAKAESRHIDTDGESVRGRPQSQLLVPGAASSKASFRSIGESASALDAKSEIGDDHLHRVTTNTGPATIDGEEDFDGEDASSHEGHQRQQESKDAFAITAQSAKLQLDLLARVSGALHSQQTLNPETPISNQDIVQAFQTYTTAVSSLNSLVADLLKIGRDREAYWQYRLERDADARKMWEESMAAIAYEHEDLKKSIAISEDKRKKTKRALKEALEGRAATSPEPLEGEPGPGLETSSVSFAEVRPEAIDSVKRRTSTFRSGGRRKSLIAQQTDLSDSESGDDDEFFDAIDAGEIEVIGLPLVSPPPVEVPKHDEKDPIAATVDEKNQRAQKQKAIEASYAGYEDGVRHKMKLDADDRPKISLWGILKSMIGKDMTKMTLPVSFNEPTSLLYRVAEDMEYADLLDIAADRPTSLERLVYVAGFGVSEYASTIGRVAKPFNPLLGETYEYVRPDKGYRFFAEQVSHHPPIGAAFAESARWDYYGESAVKTRFLGKSFDAMPLGSWYLKLRPKDGPEELYTWKKVTTTVVGIITGNPTIDNWGPMEIKNLTTGETCLLDFRARGWKASSAYHVVGKVMDKDGVTKWSIGGRWNDKMYARVTEGFEDQDVGAGKSKGANQAILVWQAGVRPTGIPFNLTPFAVTLNDDNPKLTPWLAPTDSRLRPDQRAMEDGEYDKAAEEKNRVEEKQRAARRVREADGSEYKAKFFTQKKHPDTGELYWEFNGEYWRRRHEHDWSSSESIF